ncbi:MAG: ModD protein [Actinobacteria bacterium]|nr:ModD protein [Actinomycetota bacterium]
MYVPDRLVDSLILEDVPYIDLTTTVLGFNEEQGEMEYFTRQDCTLCCIEEGVAILKKLGLEILSHSKSGYEAKAGETFLVARGSAEALHAGWKVCLNLFDYYSAVATATQRFVETVHAKNPHMSVLTTRKSIPGTKPFMTKAILCGGAFPHRLGLSETVLVFEQHLEFIGGLNGFIEKFPEIKSKCCEKKIIVEASAKDAFTLAKAGVDGIQFDKASAEELNEIVPLLREINPHITLLAAGGINASNVAEYAETGVDGLVTTSLFFVKPLDMSVRITKL